MLVVAAHRRDPPAASTIQKLQELFASLLRLISRTWAALH
jgi:hypothetical protein